MGWEVFIKKILIPILLFSNILWAQDRELKELKIDEIKHKTRIYVHVATGEIYNHICFDQNKKNNCEAIKAVLKLKKWPMPKRKHGGAQVGSLSCKDLLSGQIIKINLMSGSEMSFCKFTDGSMVAVQTLSDPKLYFISGANRSD